MCATKLHGAKIDGPAVAGPSSFAIRWPTKLHPDSIITARSGLFSFVLFFDQTKMREKCLRELLPFLSEAAAGCLEHKT